MKTAQLPAESLTASIGSRFNVRRYGRESFCSKTVTVKDETGKVVFEKCFDEWQSSWNTKEFCDYCIKATIDEYKESITVQPEAIAPSVERWAISYTPYSDTSKTSTDIVEIREDGQYILNPIDGRFNKTSVPYTQKDGNGYTWERLA